jgi:phosphatidate cytidylyltransferase
LKQRIITGVLAGGAFVALLVLGGYWFLGLVLLLAVIGYDEYIRMNDLRKMPVTRFFGLAATICLVIPWETGRIGFGLPVEAFIWLIMFVLLSVTVISKNKLTIDQAAVVFVGIIYLGFGFHYMISTRWMEPNGLFWTLLIFLCIWASDAGAYFAGVAFGKTPMWPAISPKKTIEGALGGLVLAVAVAVAFSLYDPNVLELWRAVLLGAVAAIVGQMGDLIQSAYKRVKGIKDTGTILPGHGGVLDRVDSWLIVFPFLHLVSMIPQ